MTEDLWEEWEFRSWLEEQPEGAIVGNVEHDYDCPIARYLEAKTGKAWRVNERRARKASEPWEENIPLPLWGRLFVCSVDMASTYSGPYITREQALHVLDSPWS